MFKKEEAARTVQFKSAKVKQISVRYPFRDLGNYKAMHKKRAEAKGCLKEFLGATTLTSARKIVF